MIACAFHDALTGCAILLVVFACGICTGALVERWKR